MFSTIQHSVGRVDRRVVCIQCTLYVGTLSLAGTHYHVADYLVLTKSIRYANEDHMHIWAPPGGAGVH